jgi:hypothetical protein
MSRMRCLLAWTVLAAALLPAIGARAGEAPADTTVEGYVRAMADSTDLWFGLTAQPVDTTGLDSLRTFFAAHPTFRRTRPSRASLAPVVSFNRVLGFAPGAGMSVGSARGLGRIGGAAQWAMGPNLWLGAGEYALRRTDALDSDTWNLRLHAGRDAESLDRDNDAAGLSTLYAFFAGADRSHYLRRDGALLDLSHAAPGWSAGVGARDQLESPMVTTATWYLGGHHPVVVHNAPATLARVHELSAWGVVRLPRLPYRLDAHVWRGGGGLGGDVAYTRVRASVGGALALGRHVTLATQAGYGRLTGTALPQAAFYLGGSTLYTTPENSLQGTGRTLARAELILVDPLQSLLGLEARPLFPLQLGVFGGSAARWGFDPLTGAARLTSRDGPGRSDWLSEAGFSVLYRPGLPDPDSFVRLVFAYPIGPGGRTQSITASYTRALGFLGRH